MPKFLLLIFLFTSLLSNSQEEEGYQQGNFRYEKNTIVDVRTNKIVTSDVEIIKTAYSHTSIVITNSEGVGFGENEWTFIPLKNIKSLKIEPTGDYDTGVLITEKDTIYLNFLNKRLSNLPAFASVIRELGSGVENEKIYHLDLSENELREVPSQVFKMTKMVNLELWRNSITTIPAEIKALKYLEELLLSNNNISEIPKEVGELKNLYVLNLRNNAIKSLPEEIKNLKKLIELDLRDNNISNSEREKIKLWFAGTNCNIIFDDESDDF